MKRDSSSGSRKSAAKHNRVEEISISSDSNFSMLQKKRKVLVTKQQSDSDDYELDAAMCMSDEDLLEEQPKKY